MQDPMTHLRERYDYERWRTPRADESVLGWRFFFAGVEFPGWTLHRAQSVPATRSAPPVLLSAWRPDSGANTLVTIDVYEAGSAVAAREQLLRMLGEYEGPLVERRDAPGDVAFGVGTTALLFARANYVAVLHSVEREPVAVGSFGVRLDALLVPRPGRIGRGPELSARWPAGAPLEPGQFTPIELEAKDARARPLRFTFASRSGELRIEGEHPVYIPGPAGPHVVEVWAIAPDGGASTATVRDVPEATS